MKRKAIFLSASIPVKPKPGSDEEPRLGSDDCRPLEIREAVLALVTTVTRDRVLVFGGHPAISPLIEHAARSMGTAGNVHIFQSRFFERFIPEEACRFENFHWTKRQDNKPDSLQVMREEMLSFCDYGAAFFIGGMEGIPDEHEIFRRLHPKAMTFPLASTGGAAALLSQRLASELDDETQRILGMRRRYGFVFRSLLRGI